MFSYNAQDFCAKPKPTKAPKLAPQQTKCLVLVKVEMVAAQRTRLDQPRSVINSSTFAVDMVDMVAAQRTRLDQPRRAAT